MAPETTTAPTFATSIVVLGSYRVFTTACVADNPSGPWDLDAKPGVRSYRRTIRAAVCVEVLGFAGQEHASELAQNFLEVLQATLLPEIHEFTLCAA